MHRTLVITSLVMALAGDVTAQTSDRATEIAPSRISSWTLSLAGVPLAPDVTLPLVTGNVISAGDGRPLSGVEVYLEGSPTHAITNEKGTFRLEPAAAGTWTLIVRRAGLVEARLDVDASGDAITTVLAVMRTAPPAASERSLRTIPLAPERAGRKTVDTRLR